MISRDEVLRVLDQLETTFDRAYFTTMYACGLRSGELLPLQAGDIDSAVGVVRVRNGKGSSGSSRSVHGVLS